MRRDHISLSKLNSTKSSLKIRVSTCGLYFPFIFTFNVLLLLQQFFETLLAPLTRKERNRRSIVVESTFFLHAMQMINVINSNHISAHDSVC